MLFKKYVFIIMIAFALGLPFTGCEIPVEIDEFELLAGAGDIYFTSYSTPFTGASPDITIDDLFLLLNDGDDSNDPYIIDCRSAEDYAAGHIKGAVNMALSDLDDNLDMLPTDRMIVNVCYTGQTASFATAVINLVGQDEDYAGLEARNLKFGMCSITTDTSILPEVDKWANQIAEDEGYELETTSNTTDTTYDFPDPGTGETTLAGIIKANLDNAATDWTIEAVDVYASLDDYFIVNYWPEAEYIDPGHIPGAYQFTPKEDLNSDAKLNLLPTDETIVFYCYSGQTSAQVSAYLRLLGYDVKSLLYGVNGFAYESLSKSKYTAPTTDYISIIE